jgi:hypothetical protein
VGRDGRHRSVPNQGSARLRQPSDRAVDGWPIHWMDHEGIVHACEQLDVRGGKIAWTLCGSDVADNAAYVESDLMEVTCKTCAMERWKPQQGHDDPPSIWPPDYKPPA